MTPLYSVDLFAGCGGLSLGLEQAGFTSLAYSEINKDASDTYWANLRHSKLSRFGAVQELNETEIKRLKDRWTRDLGVTDLDLVAGGPPCQGYSGIGHRRSYAVERKEIPSNFLFLEMVRVVKAFRPKLFLFENVRGLLAGRWEKGGPAGQIWRHVREEFARIEGYEIGWRVVQAKWYGVPQNRPRVLLVGARSSLGLHEAENHWADDVCNPRGLIPEPPKDCRAPDLVDVLSDLDDPNYDKDYVTRRYVKPPQSPFQEMMRRARDGTLLPDDSLLEQEYSRHSPRIVKKFTHMLRNKGAIPAGAQTKKFAQRVLPDVWDPAIGPTITATSLPDDFVHYNSPRILTVREWARLQMFPDWFEFRGPRTTGGLRRAGVPTAGIFEREVPKYTQIGNAVPVGLARAVGEHLANLLRGRANANSGRTRPAKGTVGR